MDTNGRADAAPGGGRPAPNPGLPRQGWSRGRVAALLAACAVVAGCAFAVTYAVSGPSPSATATTAGTQSASGPTGQAGALNGALADASYAASPATGTARQAAIARRVARARLRRALVRLRLLGGMYGQFSFETRQGPRTLAFERGTVTSVTGPDAVVRATDGTTWTWVLSSASIVRENGARARPNALATGDLVFAAGPVSGTTRDARLIVIRAA
jgi:hypothetical protein